MTMVIVIYSDDDDDDNDVDDFSICFFCQSHRQHRRILSRTLTMRVESNSRALLLRDHVVYIAGHEESHVCTAAHARPHKAN